MQKFRYILIVIFTLLTLAGAKVKKYDLAPFYKITKPLEISLKGNYLKEYKHKDLTIKVFKYGTPPDEGNCEIVIIRNDKKIFNKSGFGKLGDIYLLKYKDKDYFLVKSWENAGYFGDDLLILSVSKKNKITETRLKNMADGNQAVMVDGFINFEIWDRRFSDFYQSNFSFKSYYKFTGKSFIQNNNAFRDYYLQSFERKKKQFRIFSEKFHKMDDFDTFFYKFTEILSYGYLSKKKGKVENFFDNNKFFLKVFNISPEKFLSDYKTHLNKSKY